MRLLNSSTLKLVFVPSWDPPPYAILSHTWGAPEEEVLFEDFVQGSITSKGRKKPAFFKIRNACKQAKDDGLEYCWIDTCNIDKSSSAELQESINSMFVWYRNAKCCYAYLSDVADGSGDGLSFANSHWFTRGWTLQELLAPSNVTFYTRGWKCYSTKNRISERLNSITGIPIDILSGDEPISAACVAQRMAWASRRQTSRPEDVAYCLLGLFEVSMPMLYGEGQKAFERLQEEIIKSSNDQSIFAWRSDSRRFTKSGVARSGVLAHHPSQFADSASISNCLETDYPPWASRRSSESWDPWLHNKQWQSHIPYNLTNRGLQITVPLLEVPFTTHDVYLMPLECYLDDSKDQGLPDSGVIGIILCEYPQSGRIRRFYRINVGEFVYMKMTHVPRQWQTILVETAHDAGFLTKDPKISTWHCTPDASLWGTHPIYLSQRNEDRKWAIIGWTKKWNPGEKSKLDCVSLYKSDIEAFHISLGLVDSPRTEQNDESDLSHGSFWAMRGEAPALVSEDSFRSGAKRAGEVQDIEGFSVGVTCAGDFQTDKHGPIFLIRLEETCDQWRAARDWRSQTGPFSAWDSTTYT